MIRVDGVEIPEAAIGAELQHHPAASREAAWQAAAQALVVRQLLLAEVGRQGHGAGEEAVDALLAGQVPLPEADEATCRRWFAANRARLRSPEAWQARHILLAADPADAAARAAAEAEAGAIIAALCVEPDRFAALAARSACTSREEGGDLGLIEPGTTVPEFEAALRALRPGELHATPVASRYGYHVVQLLEHEPPRDLPFEAVQARIARWLREASFRTAVRQYIQVLAGRARIEGIALAAAEGPLVQ
ncbi:peptidylprolyl isomerase [Paracraurococcus lichenis]|uniref:Parvulin-like PPIase n=1 Tax=Paracraurococcus lichenis TaxID=3064888 RepID=A0ABT9E3U0_9PROT|nr:peptidylprolyl isomerase [Paracraurococcus sp. LOR1-02]MDO9710804.1 peptidylprolyl isomerase [Paracraurococcus sp. LOR1-02]